jgi:hypothetical protein
MTDLPVSQNNMFCSWGEGCQIYLRIWSFDRLIRARLLLTLRVLKSINTQYMIRVDLLQRYCQQGLRLPERKALGR